MKTPVQMTQAEWEVMTVVWQRAPVAASVVVKELHAQKQWTLATVRTLLRRLVNKGALRQQVEGKRYIYTPLVSMESCIRHESESFWKRIVDRAPSVALIHLVKRAVLSKSDIEELRRILRAKEE
jgi:BlaI family penicillinase repressor